MDSKNWMYIILKQLYYLLFWVIKTKKIVLTNLKFRGGGHEFTCIITTEGGSSVKTLNWRLAQGQAEQVCIGLYQINC